MKALLTRQLITGLATLALVALNPLAALAEHADSAVEAEGSYGFLRVIEGDATLIQVGTGTRESAEVNQPLLVGDRLWVSPGSRLEAILADRNIVRLGGDAEVELTAVAGSPDSEDVATELVLAAGTLQLVVLDTALGEELPRVVTANATVYLQEAGRYRITADRSNWTEVVVREGFAEVLTERGSLIVRDGEQAEVDGTSLPRSTVQLAAGLDGLERWGAELEAESERLASDYVDEDLRYAAAPLEEYGDWVEVDDRRAWRPRVSSGWSPYQDGRWAESPSGLTWVSYERWGWVPYHYGSWDFHGGYGWVWYPGRVFSPAWVYWYWSPTYVGWCPIGYYANYYYPRYGRGFHAGIYGYAGGDWGIFGHWNFIPTRHLRYRHHGRYIRHARYYRDAGVTRPPRGLITTDTRGITREVLRRPEEATRHLATKPIRLDALPDVDTFVGRGELPERVRRQVIASDVDRPVRLDAPLRPAKPVRTRPSLATRPLRADEAPERGRQAGAVRGVDGDRKPARVTPTGQTADGGTRLERRPAQVGTRPQATRDRDEVRMTSPERNRASQSPVTRPQTARPDTTRPSAAERPTLSRRPATARPSTERPATKPSTARPSTASPSRSDEAAESGRGPRLERRPATSSRAPARSSVARPSTARPSTARPSTSKPGVSSGSSGDRRLSTRPSSRPTTARPPARTSGSSSSRRPSASSPTQSSRPSYKAPSRSPSRSKSPASASSRGSDSKSRPSASSSSSRGSSSRGKATRSSGSSSKRSSGSKARPSPRRPPA